MVAHEVSGVTFFQTRGRRFQGLSFVCICSSPWTQKAHVMRTADVRRKLVGADGKPTPGLAGDSTPKRLLYAEHQLGGGEGAVV